MRDLIFNPLLYAEYPYQWEEQLENGKTRIVFSKKPRYTLAQWYELKNKINKINQNERNK